MKLWVIIPATLLLALMVTVAAPRCLSAASPERPVFTNKDLDRYREPDDPDTSSLPTRQAITPRAAAAAQGKEARQRQEWCDKAAKHREGSERAREKAAEAQLRIREADADPSSPKYKRDREAAGKKLKAAEQKRVQEEKALAGLEQRARRKGIPPGWLECRF